MSNYQLQLVPTRLEILDAHNSATLEPLVVLVLSEVNDDDDMCAVIRAMTPDEANALADDLRWHALSAAATNNTPT